MHHLDYVDEVARHDFGDPYNLCTRTGQTIVRNTIIIICLPTFCQVIGVIFLELHFTHLLVLSTAYTFILDNDMEMHATSE